MMQYSIKARLHYRLRFLTCSRTLSSLRLSTDIICNFLFDNILFIFA
jgi:hypothetical protein